MSEKISLTLKSAGDCPQIGAKTLAASRNFQCSKLITYLRKKLQIDDSQTIFLFYKEFAIYPDTTVGDIVDHSPGSQTIDINYSVGQAFG